MQRRVLSCRIKENLQNILAKRLLKGVYLQAIDNK